MSESRSQPPRILFVAQNHAAIRPGGAEAYAQEIHEELLRVGEFDSVFVARSGPPVSVTDRYHEGRPLTLVNDDPSQYLFYTDVSDYDWLYGRTPRKAALTRFFRDFLLEQRPDIVHFQHTMFIGYDVLRVTRNALPDVPIVFSLHEYMPICNRDGQMVRTGTNHLCQEASPRRCHECFPQITQQEFFMRERFIKSHLALVDLFVTPSAYALERYVDWGIPREKIVHAPHGRHPVPTVPETGVRRRRDRFGFFGQFTPYKGADVLLRAMSLLDDDFDGALRIHGANLDTAPAAYQEELGELLEQSDERVVMIGQYPPADLPKLMSQIDWVIVPSIWWETGPLTVLEAFQHGRPVICSNMGGMSEKVTDEVNGLYFRRGDPASLAAVMRRAASEPALWKQLQGGIPQVQSMQTHVASLAAHYKRLLDRYATDEAPDSAEALSHA